MQNVHHQLREKDCVCVSGGQREGMCACVYVRERHRECICVCVYIRERHRECVCAREREWFQECSPIYEYHTIHS